MHIYAFITFINWKVMVYNKTIITVKYYTLKLTLEYLLTHKN